ncbi:MAG: hypothetical protein ABIW33_05850 [Sphingomicrobium sp.]
MASVAGQVAVTERRPDALSGTERAHSIDRWIFVGMAAWFIVIVLAGFVPDSMMKVGMVEAGARPPFPPILHVHAVLMGTFLLLLLAQTLMVATGRGALHKQVGIAAFVLVPALVVVGMILAPTMYYQAWGGANFGPPPVRAALAPVVPLLENILLLQITAGLMFATFIAIALTARAGNSGLHKRMMILATAVPLVASIDRMHWLPSTFPVSPVASDFYLLAAVSPMFIWDVVRNRRVHQAYWIWLGIYVPVAVAVTMLWDTPAWHSAARAIMGV